VETHGRYLGWRKLVYRDVDRSDRTPIVSLLSPVAVIPQSPRARLTLRLRDGIAEAAAVNLAKRPIPGTLTEVTELLPSARRRALEPTSVTSVTGHSNPNLRGVEANATFFSDGGYFLLQARDIWSCQRNLAITADAQPTSTAEWGGAS
jgi:hypothetical protein